jgi:protein tyrosine/serine phosphatase
MAERAVAFTNVFNFRDLGGYRTADGAIVRWRRLYRADDLSHLDSEDYERFAELGIRTVVDLRRPHEIEELGRVPEMTGMAYHHVHLVHPQWQPPRFESTDERTEYVIERYREMADVSADGLGQALRLIADPDRAPLVFHCIAGKDRTGILAALTLSLLGVSDHDVIDDYHLSELAEPRAWERYTRIRRPDLLGLQRPYEASPRAAMVGFLANLRLEHGSVENYAASVGLTAKHIAAMKAHLLDS